MRTWTSPPPSPSSCADKSEFMGARDRRTFQLPDTSKLRAWMDISERFLQAVLLVAGAGAGAGAVCCLLLAMPRCRGLADDPGACEAQDGAPVGICE